MVPVPQRSGHSSLSNTQLKSTTRAAEFAVVGGISSSLEDICKDAVLARGRPHAELPQGLENLFSREGAIKVWLVLAHPPQPRLHRDLVLIVVPPLLLRSSKVGVGEDSAEVPPGS